MTKGFLKSNLNYQGKATHFSTTYEVHQLLNFVKKIYIYFEQMFCMWGCCGVVAWHIQVQTAHLSPLDGALKDRDINAQDISWRVQSTYYTSFIQAPIAKGRSSELHISHFLRDPGQLGLLLGGLGPRLGGPRGRFLMGSRFNIYNTYNTKTNINI